MIKAGVPSELGWKEEEDLAKARQRIESDLASKNLELDLHLESVVKKIDQMVIDTLKVKEGELSEQFKGIKDQEEERRKKNRECLMNLEKDLNKLDLNDIEDWAFSRLCASDNEEGLTYD